jgi:hypothetical protein
MIYFEWAIIILVWLVGNTTTKWMVEQKRHSESEYPFFAHVFWPVKLFCALVKAPGPGWDTAKIYGEASAPKSEEKDGAFNLDMLQQPGATAKVDVQGKHLTWSKKGDRP